MTTHNNPPVEWKHLSSIRSHAPKPPPVTLATRTLLPEYYWLNVEDGVLVVRAVCEECSYYIEATLATVPAH